MQSIQIGKNEPKTSTEGEWESILSVVRPEWDRPPEMQKSAKLESNWIRAVACAVRARAKPR